MITLNFDEVLERTYNAKKGVEVRYGLGQGFEYCKQFADSAKADAEKATQTIQNVDQSKEEAKAAMEQAKSAASSASESASTAASAASSATSSAQSASTDASRAKAEADRAAAIVSTDKSLSVDGAPADAKAVGEALAEKLGAHDTAEDSNKFSGLSFRCNHNLDDTYILLLSERNIDYILKDEIANINGVASSGNGYVRFTDGTQICYGEQILKNADGLTVDYQLSLPQAFANDAYIVVFGMHWSVNYEEKVITIERTTTSITARVMNTASNDHSFFWTAIGRWK